MSVLAIELNDAGIRAAKDTEPGLEAFPPSPGIALWDGERLVTGAEASRRARFKPRWSYDRFWRELDTSPLPPPFPSHLRRADLVHAQLEEIWSATSSGVDEVLLAIPGSYSPEQLGLILGIARSCRMPVSGLVDHAVAASLLAGKARHLVHLDLHLHRTVATKVKRERSLERIEVLVDDEQGSVGLWDAWIQFVSQAFVRATRFDPLHRGETEQALYHRLPEWLEALRQSESAVLEMPGPDKTYSVELTRKQIVDAARPRLERIAQLARSSQTAGEPTVLLVTPSVGDLPGMMEALTESELEVLSLPAGAGAMGALKAKHVIRAASNEDDERDKGRSLPFLTRLPLEPGRPQNAPRPGSPRVPPLTETSAALPTHVLCDGRAHAITSRPLVLGLGSALDGPSIDLSTSSASTAGISRSHCTLYRRDGRVVLEDHSRYGTFVNDKRVEGETTLASGDRLRVGTPGIELRLIQVVDSDGTSKD